MNLLIVDDEIYIVRVLQKNIDWDALGITEVFAAYNVERAKNILTGQKIDILITDIEMPRESGLDLLEWIQNKSYGCKSICLTCHDEFQYAQRAIQYQVCDYILKPVDFRKLGEMIFKTVKQIRKERAQEDQSTKGVLWGYNQEKLEAAFWRGILLENPAPHPEALIRQAAKTGITWDFNQQYQLVLFSVKRIYERKQEWHENVNQMQYIIYNISRDIFLDAKDSGKTGWFNTHHMWAIIPVERTTQLQEKLENFVELCHQIIGIGIVVYLDEICFGEELHSSYQRLMDYDKENVFQEKGIFDTLQQDEEQTHWSEFYMSFRSLLKAKKFQEAEKLADTIWDEKHNVSSRNLILNVSAGYHEIGLCLEENQITTESFFEDELLEMMGKVYYSADIYKDWLKAAVKRLEHLCREARAEMKAIAQIRQYVQAHIEARISREDIAEHVSFSPDYVSRVFKKEAGISLSEYIMEQKIERAKELIEAGEDSIGNIATRMGYSSFSYFTEVFRRFTGVLPSEYKRISKT